MRVKDEKWFSSIKTISVIQLWIVVFQYIRKISSNMISSNMNWTDRTLKHMTIREKRDTPGIKLTQSDWGETGSQGTHGGGGKNTTKQSRILTYRPPPGRCVLAPLKHPKGKGRWELGRRLRRRTDTREGAGRQRPGRRRRREEPGKRQEGPGAGGAQLDPGHSHDDGPQWSRRREEPWWRDGRRLQGLTNGGGAGGGGARGGDGEPTSQGDAGDPGGHGGADGSGDRGEGGSPEIRSGAGATEDPGGADGRKEPNGAGGTEQRGAVQRRWRVNARPRRSRRYEGARWSW